MATAVGRSFAPGAVPLLAYGRIVTSEQAMTDAGLTFTSEIFEGAGHGYSMSDAAVYDEAAAERHFRELLALLDRTLSVS